MLSCMEARGRHVLCFGSTNGLMKRKISNQQGYVLIQFSGTKSKVLPERAMVTQKNSINGDSMALFPTMETHLDFELDCLTLVLLL